MSNRTPDQELRLTTAPVYDDRIDYGGMFKGSARVYFDPAEGVDLPGDLLFRKPRTDALHKAGSNRLETEKQEDGIKKQEIILPHKAIPETLGRVFCFSTADSMWGTEREEFSQYLFLIAHDLMYTDIAEEQGGYPAHPSVLVVEPGKSSIGLAHRALQKQRRSFTNRRFRPYGTRNRSRSLGFKEGSKIFSEASMLASIEVSTDTGIHTLSISSSSSDKTWVTTLDAARRFFDIVLVSPDAPVLDQADFITSISVGYQENKIYDTSEVAGESIAYCQKIEDFIEANMFKEAQVYLIAPSMLSFSVMRSLAHDFIRYLLGVKNPIQSTSVIPARPLTKVVNSWAKRVVSKFAEADVITIQLAIVSMIGYGIFATGVGMGLQALGLERFAFLLGVVPAIGALFAVRLVCAGAIRGFVRIAERRSLRRLKSSFKQLKPGYSYAPLAESAMMKSIDRKQYFTEKVERVDLGTTVVEPDSLPLDALNIRIGELKERWMAYEVDPMKALEYPMLLDASFPSTAAFLTAYQELSSYERKFRDDPSKAGLLAASLSKAEEAFIVAESAAKKSRLSHLSSEQKKRLKSAKPLVAIASNDSSSPTERIGAWKRANDLLEGVLSLPDASVVGLLEE